MDPRTTPLVELRLCERPLGINWRHDFLDLSQSGEFGSHFLVYWK